MTGQRLRDLGKKSIEYMVDYYIGSENLMILLEDVYKMFHLRKENFEIDGVRSEWYNFDIPYKTLSTAELLEFIFTPELIIRFEEENGYSYREAEKLVLGERGYHIAILQQVL